MRKLIVTLLLVVSFIAGYFLRVKGIEGLRESSPPTVEKPVKNTSVIPVKTFSHIVEKIAPSVVNIEAIKKVQKLSSYPLTEMWDDMVDLPDEESPGEWEEENLGSGVIVSPDGYIITNYHVVKGAEKIKVTLYNKNVIEGTLFGTDTRSDIAVIKINSSQLETITWGDSDTLKVGDFVLAFGNPYGLSHSVSMGIVSAIERGNIGISEYESFIQTDAAINPGNSGGPLVSVKGEFIGLNAAIFSRNGGYQGIGFAVPSNMAKTVVKDLIEKGKVTRGWIGLTIQEITPDLAKGFGLDEMNAVVVVNVDTDSPASKAQVQKGDIILAINGKPIQSSSSFRNIVSLCPVNSSARLKIKRHNKELSLSAKVAALPQSGENFFESPSSSGELVGYNEFFGCIIVDMSYDIAVQLGIPHEDKGVVVMSVRPGGAADESGLIKGDIIEEVNREEVRNFHDFQRIISLVSKGDVAIIFVNRKGYKFFNTIKIKES